MSTAVNSMFGSIAPRYDLTNCVLSLGSHNVWRWALFHWIDKLVPNAQNLNALDVCTGTGDLLRGLEKRFSKVIGLDFCAPMLEEGKKRGRFRRSQLVQGDGLCLPLPDRSFDVITIAYGVRNFDNAADGLKELLRVLKPNGRLFVLEFGQPVFGPLRFCYNLYSKYGIPLIGSLLTGNRNAYTYLPRTAKTFPSGQSFCTLLAQVGYQDASTKELQGGIAYIYAAKKSPEL